MTEMQHNLFRYYFGCIIVHLYKNIYFNIKVKKNFDDKILFKNISHLSFERLNK